MGTVRLRFSPMPSHVRTARLVAATVARRVGMPEPVVEEIRLAVGEACTLVVGRQAGRAAANGGSPVQLAIEDGPYRLAIEVSDEVPGAAGGESFGDPDERDQALGLAVLSGLTEDLKVADGPGGAVVRLSWPLPRP